MKPIIINDFRNAFYVEKMIHRNMGGVWSLALGGEPVQEATSGSALFTNQQVFTGMARFYDYYSGGGYNFLYAIGNKYISRYYESDYNSNASHQYSKQLHTIGYDPCGYPDIIKTELGTMFYTSKRYLGKAIFGTAKSTQNYLVDSAGRNLETLGATATVDYCYNLDSGEGKVIATIENGDATNDKATFSGGLNFVAGDKFVIFNDNAHDLDDTVGSSHFSGQESQSTWSRQIIDFDGEYYIMNGNYLASLDNTEATFDSDTLQLKPFMQGICASVNNNLMLIGGSLNGKGKLLLWDGAAATFERTQDVPQIVRSIVPYKGGWIFFAGSSIYFTDGYTYKEIDRIPDTDGMDLIYMAPNGMAVVGEYLVMRLYSGHFTRKKTGVYLYNLNIGKFTYIPTNEYVSPNTSTGAVFYDSENRKFAVSTSKLDSGDNAVVDVYSLDLLSSENSDDNGMMIYYLPASEKIAKSLKVVISRDERTSPDVDMTGYLTVGIADTQRVLWDYTTITAVDTGTSFTINALNAQVGDMIRIMNGDEVGELAFISAITNNASTQTITLDRSVGTSYWAGNYVQVMPFKKVGQFTITNETESPYYCNVGQGTGIYIMVYLKGAWLSLRSIEIE